MINTLLLRVKRSPSRPQLISVSIAKKSRFMQPIPLLLALVLLLGCTRHSEPVAPTMSIHSTLESICGHLSSPSEGERASFLKLGVSESAVASLFSQWLDGSAGVGSHDLMNIREIAEFDWQENSLKVGLLTIRSCANGDPIAIDVSAGPPWPIYYISHEHEGLYDGSDLTRIKVADSVEKFMIECDADEDYPWDYFEAEDRLKTDG